MMKEMPSMEQEPQGDKWSIASKFNSFLEKCNIPDKTKNVIILTMTTAMLNSVAAEAQEKISQPDRDESEKESAFSSEAQKEIKQIIEDINEGKRIFFSNMSDKAGVSPEQLSEEVALETNYEEDGADISFERSDDDPNVQNEGEDLYFASYSGSGIVADTYSNEKVDESNIWNKHVSGYKMYKFNDVEVEPSGKELISEAEGVTEKEAILEALEDAANKINGLYIVTETSLEETESTGGSEDKYSEIFKKHVGVSYSACIDSYKVVNVEKNEDGMYSVKLEVVAGKVKQ